MEKAKHDELLLLIAIRNNSKIPIDEFYKLFDDNWYVFSPIFNDLETKGLFTSSALEHLPGLHKYELTKKGNLRISELLSERSNAIDLNLAQPGNKRVQGTGIFRRILAYFMQNPARFKIKHSGNI